MKYRILDVNGDYSFGKGQQNITYGTFAVAQAIKTRLLLLKGEWWENKEEGLPLFQDILSTSGGVNNLAIVDNLIKERIIKTKDVIGIKDFQSNFDNRIYSFSCKVDTKYGETNLSLNF